MRSIITRHSSPSIEWRNLPKALVGGDSFGYNWLDTNHLAIYMIDVVGHGRESYSYAAAILKALEALHLMRDPLLLVPEKLLHYLNQEYQMSTNNNAYFTLWYGLYNTPKKLLTYASGGAPPAVLMPKGELLSSHGTAIGMIPEARYEALSVKVEKAAQLYIFSDGVYELLKQDGTTGTFLEFLAELKKKSDLDELVRHAKAVSGSQPFQDDFCLIKVQF